jgi:hypothetical protein
MENYFESEEEYRKTVTENLGIEFEAFLTIYLSIITRNI